MHSATDIRKRPSQERSRQRVGKILEVAAERISEVGADQLKMSDIAKLAGVPIGSIYQYFPNKSSIIRSLAESHLEQLREVVLENLATVKEAPDGDDVAAIQLMSNRIIDTYYSFYLNEPAFAALWGGIQADAMLTELEVKDTQETADILHEILKPIFPPMSEARGHALTLVICNQIGATLRFALQLGEEQGQELVEMLKEQIGRVARSYIEERSAP